MNDERYISVEKSIINACREVKEMRNGNLSEPVLENFFAEMNNLITQEKINANYTDNIPNDNQIAMLVKNIIEENNEP